VVDPPSFDAVNKARNDRVDDRALISFKVQN